MLAKLKLSFSPLFLLLLSEFLQTADFVLIALTILPHKNPHL
jgi:hypothetical protein